MMIDLYFSLAWPTKRHRQTNLITFDKPISKNKSLSFQVSRGGGGHFVIFRFELNFDLWGVDHAGVHLNLAFMDSWIIINFYDSRHWDDDKWEWEVYE